MIKEVKIIVGVKNLKEGLLVDLVDSRSDSGGESQELIQVCVSVCSRVESGRESKTLYCL